jgi:endoglucanase
MKIRNAFRIIGFASLCFQVLAGGSAVVAGQSTKFLGRGVTANGKIITETDLADFAATGGNLVRLQLQFMPLRDVTPPYAINEGNLALLERDLDWCAKHNLNCIVDPHLLPGLRESRDGTDPMWTDPRFGDMAVSLWSFIAQRLSHRGSEVAGYDLMNEPLVPGGAPKSSVGDWDHLANRMIAAIRAYDTTHPIIIEAPDVVIRHGQIEGRLKAIESYFSPPADSNLIYSVHVYNPMGLTYDRQAGAHYPGVIDGRQWDARMIAQDLAPVVAFQKKYQVQIYVGEIGSARWTGDNGNRWIKDQLEFYEAHHWSWTYINWRGADIWDAEKNNYDAGDKQRYASTQRLSLLHQYWKRGRQP